MGYNAENCRKIAAIYSEKNFRAQKEAEARKEKLHMLFPEIAEIDRVLSETGMKIFSAALSGEGNIDKRIAELKRANDELLEARREILVSHGYPADYSDLKFECDKCRDTGYVEGKMCSCMRRDLVMAGYESSGIGKLIAKQNFENFDLSYYKGAEYEQMSRVFESVSDFANTFRENSGRNLLFIGMTGLGKTHLSSACAKAIIERGFDVVYESAQNIFSDFEYERFSRGYNNDEQSSKTDRYFECDLLIIDDLGTELSNQFTTSCLYNIVNTRMCAGKSIIINTNLKRGELMEKYQDRVTSRLFGEFEVCLFVGRDIRSQKLERGRY
ncbi:MAG: ATP-binding protein [Clostridia bacterium]|nr:ATP-binding protein [Clostridia bacterium]